MTHSQLDVPEIPDHPPALAIATTCDFCHAPIAPGELSFRLNIVMNEESSGHTESNVEEETELTVCPRCEPIVAQKVDRLLTELWELIDEKLPL